MLDFQPEIVRSPVDVLGTDVSGEKPSEKAVAEPSVVQECPGLRTELDVDRPRFLDREDNRQCAPVSDDLTRPNSRLAPASA